MLQQHLYMWYLLRCGTVLTLWLHNMNNGQTVREFLLRLQGSVLIEHRFNGRSTAGVSRAKVEGHRARSPIGLQTPQ
jgi:hypothetical protein